MPAMNNRIAIFLHSGDYDRLHQALAIALAGAAMGRQVDLYFFWWALDRLIRGDLDLPNFAAATSQCEGEARARFEDIDDRFEAGNLPSARQMLDCLSADERVHLFACSGSLAILGARSSAVAGKVEALVGWSTILERTAGVVDRFVF